MVISGDDYPMSKVKDLSRIKGNKVHFEANVDQMTNYRIERKRQTESPHASTD